MEIEVPQDQHPGGPQHQIRDEDIQMHCFENGTSLAVKLSNWSQLGKFFAKRNLKPIRELIDGTIHCKPGAAEVFVQDIYTMLTNRRIKHSRDEEIDFTDRIYQEKLPMVARSTASRAIKTNIKLTELMVEPNIDKNRQKVNAIINMHMHRRLLDREQDPGEWLFQNIVWKTELQCAITKPLNLAFPPNIHSRFDIKPTLGERAVRRPSVLAPSLSATNLQKEKSIPAPSSTPSTEIRGKMGVHFKTIQVKQAERCPFDANKNV
nr:Spermatogenesis-associated protein 4 [Varanus komodoensis]